MENYFKKAVIIGNVFGIIIPVVFIIIGYLFCILMDKDLDVLILVIFLSTLYYLDTLLNNKKRIKKWWLDYKGEKEINVFLTRIESFSASYLNKKRFLLRKEMFDSF